ncbi:heavy-metal-associated domain-containing protein [Rathayibacter soli]|uniref:heavy-metal-associated domain-containing protein n=1 Tax=Rathayibacter soli TaxID=3144168 RepID=UPI0027E4AD18|nr:heavy metal-associated domain-containing protein [Glaciibacter superstes]
MTSDIHLQVRGMDCEKCELRIASAVSRLEGVRNVSADYRSGKVRVLAESELARDAVTRQVTDAGHDVDD